MLTGKATQTTISQTSIFLHVFQFLHVQTQLRGTAGKGQMYRNEKLFSHAANFHNFIVIWAMNKASLSHLVRGLIACVLQCQVHHSVLESAPHVEL